MAARGKQRASASPGCIGVCCFLRADQTLRFGSLSMAECKDGKRRREHFSAVLPFRVAEKIVDKPCKIRGIAMTAGMSRNRNVYTAEELQAFAPKLVGAPIYMEHVSAVNAVGKVTKTEWIAPNLWYEAEVYDDQVAEQIRKGLIQHVSVGADYDALDVVDAAVPHGLHDAELSLVAVPGIPEANIQVLERLRESLASKGLKTVQMAYGDLPSDFTAFKVRFHVNSSNPCERCAALNGKEFIYGAEPELPLHENCQCGYEFVERLRVRREQVDPLVAGEYYLGFYQDPASFLPEHFRTVWLDQANGVLAVMAKSKADPAKEVCQSILFLKSKWQPNTVADWLVIHPDYSVPANGSASQAVQSGVESLKEEELKKLIEDGVKEGLRKAGIAEAEWDTEYINNLSDEAFAYIAPGGEKDDQGKTVPRSLRNLPYKNAEGNLDADHTRNALARLDQTDISAEAKAEATRKLCAAAAELKIESAVCGLTSTNETLSKKLSEAETKLTDTTSKLEVANKTVEDLRKLLPGGGLLVNPPKMMPITEAVGILEGLLPQAPAVERSSMGMQRECQTIRSEILKLKERAK